MPTGYSGTPLPRKLGIKSGARVGTIRAPAHFPDLLDPLPDGARVMRVRRGAPPYDVVVAFAADLRALERELDRGVAAIDIDGGLWVAWPKRSSELASDVMEADVRRSGLATGLVDNKICAIDEDWSGLRFVVRLEDRGGRRGSRARARG